MEPWLIVGAGRLGLQLARGLSQRDVPLAGVLCRSPESRANAGKVLPEQLLLDADDPLPVVARVLLAVRDREIEETARALAPRLASQAVILHCSGALGPAVLEPLTQGGFATGVFHPLLPFPHPLEPPVDFRGAVVTLAGHPVAVAAARELAQALGMLPVEVSNLTWPLYHAAAALAGPLVYALLQAAQEELQRAGFPAEKAPQAVANLAKTAAEHAHRAAGWGLLTGPLVRGDWETVRAHRSALQPEVRAMYDAITAFTRARLGGGLPPEEGESEEE